ncbi:GtrA family protein [Erwiniaceae bacterium L1_54_6]|jgi:putative flippase GtrA|nr:GtrA family protein [Erwiniaceae bacterium L1_54_6]
MISPQFLRFLVAGGIAASANFGSRFVFSMFVGYGFAVFFAYLVGMLVAFLLMRGHVFNASQGPLAPQVYKFVAVNILAVLQTLAISLLLARWLLPSFGIVDHAEAIGHLVGVLVPVVTSYFGHKLLTFR